MARMLDLMAQFIRDAGGATAIEYGLILALIGIALITALTMLQNDIWEVANTISSYLASAQ